MSFAFGPPQGPPTSSVAGSAQVSTSTVTASTSDDTFFNTSGTGVGYTYGVIAVPAGAARLFAVAAVSVTNPGQVLWASPLGYADGSTSTCLAVNNDAPLYRPWVAGGDLSLTTSSILVPLSGSGSTWDVAVIYSTTT